MAHIANKIDAKDIKLLSVFMVIDIKMMFFKENTDGKESKQKL